MADGIATIDISSGLTPVAPTAAPSPKDIPPAPQLAPKIDISSGLIPQNQIPGMAPDITNLATAAEVGKGAAVGFVKGAGQTAAGLGELAHIPGSQKLAEISQPKGFSEGLGSALEGTTEFIGGEEALGGLSKLAKVGKYAPEIIQLMEDYPKASKLILGMLKGGTVGAAQGAVKGEASGEGAGEGAKTGAEFGAAGGALAEATPMFLGKVSQMLGLGGQTFESGMVKAGRPAVTERNWKQSLEIAKPLILDNIEPKSVKTIDDFTKQIKDLRNGVWDEVQKGIQQTGKGVFSGKNVAQSIESSITPELQHLFPEEAEDIRKFAQKFDKNMTIEEAHNSIELMNAKLKKFYAMSASDQSAAAKVSGDIQKLETASDMLREKMFDEIEARGAKNPRELRQQYGALADIERVFNKRIPVADRQQPINLAQLLSLAGGASEAVTAVALGHPAAAAAGLAAPVVATAVKARQAPESLIRQGLKAGAKEGLPESAVSRGAKEAAAGATTQAGPWVRMQLPGSKQHVEVHPEDVDEAVKRGLIHVNPENPTGQ